jgi:hypothetical protein
MRVQLAATVAADGDRGNSRGMCALANDVADDVIDECCVVAQQARGVGRCVEGVAQRLALAPKLRAPVRDAIGGVARRGEGRVGRDRRRRHAAISRDSEEGARPRTS